MKRKLLEESLIAIILMINDNCTDNCTVYVHGNITIKSSQRIFTDLYMYLCLATLNPKRTTLELFMHDKSIFQYQTTRQSVYKKKLCHSISLLSSSTKCDLLHQIVYRGGSKVEIQGY